MVPRPGLFPVGLLLLLTGSVVADDEEAKDKPKFDVALEFEGNDTLARAGLRQALNALVADLRVTGVDESAVADARYLVERHYNSRGFSEARVECEVTSEADAKTFTLTFRIREGPRTLVDKVEITGNKRFESAFLLDCFTWDRHGVAGELLGIGKKIFTPRALDDGVDCIEGLYSYEGYLFVETSFEVVTGDDYRVRVTVDVKEGRQIRLRGVRVEGVEAFSVEEVTAEFGMDGAPPFDPRLPLILKGRVLEFYKTRGHRNAAVHVERTIDAERAAAFLTLHVTEGPVARIEKVDFGGNELTFEWVLEQYMEIEAGDIYNEDFVRQSYRGLIGSGLFDSVRIDSEEVGGNPERVILRVNVVEKDRFVISTLVGYGSWEQLRGSVVLENRNIFRTGHRVRTQGWASFKGEGVRGEYLNPHFFVDDLSQNLSSRYERREQRSFESQEIGGDVGFGYRVTRNLTTRWFYEARQSDVLAVDSMLPPEFTEDVLLGSLNLVGNLDTRDSFLAPKKGLNVRAALEYAGTALGSDIDFLRSVVSSSWVQPLPLNLSLALNAETGVIGRLAGTRVIPIQERFFAGGDTTIRSFREDDAGPKINGEPVGGESVVVFNAEVRYPLGFFPLLENVKGAIFGDAGTVNQNLTDYGGGRYFFGVGTGLRYNTPVGPVRVDFAFNPDRKADEDLFVFHFGLGYPF